MNNIIEKIKTTTNINNDFIDQCYKYLDCKEMIQYEEIKDIIGYKQ